MIQSQESFLSFLQSLSGLRVWVFPLPSQHPFLPHACRPRAALTYLLGGWLISEVFVISQVISTAEDHSPPLPPLALEPGASGVACPRSLPHRGRPKRGLSLNLGEKGGHWLSGGVPISDFLFSYVGALGWPGLHLPARVKASLQNWLQVWSGAPPRWLALAQ